MPNEYQRSVQEVLTGFGTDPSLGLMRDEARRRLAQSGPNQLAAEPSDPPWKRFARQFSDVLVILLLIATAISAALWLYERDSALPYEAIAISAVVVLNALMGYVQESRAESAVAALRQIAAAQARVVREREPRTVLATELV